MMMRRRLARSAALPLLAALLVLSLLVPQVAWAGDNAWTPIGPYGGDLQIFAFHPSQPSVLWAGTTTNGVFRSTDGGVTWTPTNQGLPASRSVGFLDVSTAGDSLALYINVPGGGLYRSIDGGRWERMSPEAGPPVRLLAADPARSDVLWASGGFETPGIFRSDDGGANWTEAHSLAGGSLGARPLGFVFAPAAPSNIYAALESSPGSVHGVLRSRDGGATWEVAANGLDLPEDSHSYVHLEIAPDTGVLFASVQNSGTASGVYRSADGGDHWVKVLSDPEKVTAGPGGLVLSPSGYRSVDGGLTWSELVLPDRRIYVLDAHPLLPGRVFINPPFRGIFRSTDSGTSWSEANQGLLAAHALDLVVDPIHPGTLYASLEVGGLFKTTQGGLVWEHLLPAPGTFDSLAIDELAAAASGGETTLYAISQKSKILRSEDSGASWTDLGNPGIYEILALAVDPRAPGTLYIGGNAFEQCPTRKSTDGGVTWKCLGLGKTAELVVDPARPANLWAISRTAYRSSDRGRTWKAIGKGVPKDNLLTLAVAPSARDIAYAGAWQGAYKTVNGGASWTPINTGLPPFPKVVALAVHPRNPSIVYAGVEEFSPGIGGVYRSTDGGSHWKKLPVGLPGRFVGPLVIDPHDPRTLYAGTSSRGFYVITLRR